MLNYFEGTYAIFLSIVLVVAGYQFYFFPQRNPLKEASIRSASRFDEKIPFRPKWVWIYSGAYYPFIVLPIFTLSSLTEFYSACLSYVVLLFVHIIISFFYPVRTPAEWRSYSASCASTKFLKFIQRIDKGGNCFPSMHVAVAALTAIHITANAFNELGLVVFVVWLLPMLISASAVYTKQHFCADIAPAFLLAGAIYGGYYYGLAPLILDGTKFFFLMAMVVVGLFFPLIRTLTNHQLIAPSRRPALRKLATDNPD